MDYQYRLTVLQEFKTRLQDRFDKEGPIVFSDEPCPTCKLRMSVREKSENGKCNGCFYKSREAQE